MGGSLEKVRKLVNETFYTKFKSVKPIRNWLKNNKYRSVNKILIDPFPKKIILKRLTFCRKYLKDMSISRKILFTDEKTFAVKTKHHKGDKMRIQFGSKDHYTKSIVHNNDFVKIAAGISYYGKTPLIFLPKKFNSKVYTNEVLPIYLQEVQKHRLKYFMQDNSGIHLEKISSRPFLEKFENVLDWPARSPDLNPIENLWSYLSYKIRNRKYENHRQLRMVISEEYEKIPHSIIQNLANSFYSRLKACIEKKGQLVNLSRNNVK
jgi:transposase